MSADGSAEKKESATGFITTEDKNRGTANEQQRTPGDALAGSPGDNTDESKYSYRAQRHEFNGEASTEHSPSVGWRRVYVEMGVPLNGR